MPSWQLAVWLLQRLEPRLLGGDRVAAVAAGYAHSSALTLHGRVRRAAASARSSGLSACNDRGLPPLGLGEQVYMWGFNRSGQCGVEIKLNTIFEPVPLEGQVSGRGWWPRGIGGRGERDRWKTGHSRSACSALCCGGGGSGARRCLSLSQRTSTHGQPHLCFVFPFPGRAAGGGGQASAGSLRPAPLGHAHRGGSLQPGTRCRSAAAGMTAWHCRDRRPELSTRGGPRLSAAWGFRT